ncbi:unnamed protein product [Thelazia callipaeda]|uniref:Phorbol-ester/DAG-type domain-containing protein n=1 Tax=Thelazia callipaeda TaxID=103827 RepID=A0A158RCJ5_THECL|nr:unnamed protein product [Thelazia callipaeda]
MENMRINWHTEKLRADSLQEQINAREFECRFHSFDFEFWMIRIFYTGFRKKVVPDFTDSNHIIITLMFVNFSTVSSGLCQKNKVYKEQLRDARAQILSLMSDKQNLERDIAEMEKKFALVSELLKKDQSLLKDEDRQKLLLLNKKAVFNLPPVAASKVNRVHHNNAQTLSHGENIDYDKTGDSIDISYDDSDESNLRMSKTLRRSQSVASVHNPITIVKRSKESKRMDTVDEEMGTPCKRSKDEKEVTRNIAIMGKDDVKKPSTANISIRRSRNRSMSESNILKVCVTLNAQSFAFRVHAGTFIFFLQQSEEAENLGKNSNVARYGASALDLEVLDNFRRSPYSVVKTWTNGASIETRPHSFVNFTSILGDRCEVCNRWIGLAGKASYKCADCGIRLHKLCVRTAPIPCVPRTATPRTPGKQRPRLKDFCPSTQPMIPPLIIHCVLALDKDRLGTEGIYRIPGQESQVVKLLNELKNGRSLPKLEYQDTETITGCIKRFLREIRDPVIPASSWEEFVTAAQNGDREALNLAVMDLPYPNRDTLAFLCSHFQRVCDNSSQNKMTADVLARSIAPTIVGRAPPCAMSMEQNADEIAKQIMVMLLLLEMPREYWPKFYTCNYGKPLPRSPISPANALFVENEKKRTPVRPLLKMLDNTARKDPNKSMLGPVKTSPTEEYGRNYILSNKRTKLFTNNY